MSGTKIYIEPREVRRAHSLLFYVEKDKDPQDGTDRFWVGVFHDPKEKPLPGVVGYGAAFNRSTRQRINEASYVALRALADRNAERVKTGKGGLAEALENPEELARVNREREKDRNRESRVRQKERKAAAVLTEEE